MPDQTEVKNRKELNISKNLRMPELHIEYFKNRKKKLPDEPRRWTIGAYAKGNIAIEGTWFPQERIIQTNHGYGAESLNIPSVETSSGAEDKFQCQECGKPCNCLYDIYNVVSGRTFRCRECHDDHLSFDNFTQNLYDMAKRNMRTVGVGLGINPSTPAIEYPYEPPKPEGMIPSDYRKKRLNYVKLKSVYETGYGYGLGQIPDEKKVPMKRTIVSHEKVFTGRCLVGI